MHISLLCYKLFRRSNEKIRNFVLLILYINDCVKKSIIILLNLIMS